MSYALLYQEHLSEQDLDLLARVGDESHDPEDLSARLREQPELIEDLLASPQLFDTVFNDAPDGIPPPVTPFLVFSVLVHRMSRELMTASYIEEWTGPGHRLPVFDVNTLLEFVSVGANRYFLIELLSSFVRVASGSIWVRTRKGYRRRRYSELDPVRLAEMVDMLPPAQQPGGFRRLGDVALFLAGVFPDHTATHPPAVPARERLARSAGVSPITALDEGNSLDFHEIVGANWYRRAADLARASMGAEPSHLHQVADQFRPARRFLNVLTDRYLFRYDTGLMRPAG